MADLREADLSYANLSCATLEELDVMDALQYLLLNHKKLRNVLTAITERGVLLLGRFGGGGLEVLQAVAAKLREAKYLPIIFDFERPVTAITQKPSKRLLASRASSS